jgi:hypothetical protein
MTITFVKGEKPRPDRQCKGLHLTPVSSHRRNPADPAAMLQAFRSIRHPATLHPPSIVRRNMQKVAYLLPARTA